MSPTGEVLAHALNARPWGMVHHSSSQTWRMVLNYTCVHSPSSPLWLDFFSRGFSDSTCRLLLCGSIPLVHHEYAGMNELACTHIRLPTGVNYYISYYRVDGEVGKFEVVVTLVWQWIRVGSRIRREQSLMIMKRKGSTTIM